MESIVTDSPWIRALAPSISEILQVSGAAGGSIRVVDGRSSQKHVASLGHRDVDGGKAPDEHTVYHIAYLSKSFTAAAIGILAEEGKLSFNDRMCDVLPSFNHSDEAISTCSTILDFLSHRTGLATKNALWQQDGHELLLEQRDTVPVVSYLEPIEPVGAKWVYNNWGYDIMSDVITAQSGVAWGEFLETRIIKPLGLGETTTRMCPPEENWA